MPRTRTTVDTFEVQGRYPDGWECLTTHLTRREALTDLRLYDEGEPAVPHRVKLVRERIPTPPAAAPVVDDPPMMECRCGDVVPLAEYLANDRWGGCCDSCARKDDGEGAE